MSRLFTFGCSFTSYYWPTWADILASRFEQHQNWARGGAGNQYITNSLVECHLKNKISDLDTVGIMWTNVSRLDSYKNKQWHVTGNMYTDPVIDRKIIDHFDDTRGLFIRDLASIYLAHQLLNSIGCRYYIFSMVDIHNHLQFEDNDASHMIADLLPFYQDTLDAIRPSVHQVIFNHDWQSRPFREKDQIAKLKQHYHKVSGPDWPEFEAVFDDDTLKQLDKKIVKEIFNLNKWDWKKMFDNCRRSDIHPTPLEHLEYLAQTLPEEPISFETYNLVRQIDSQVQNGEIVDAALAAQIYKSDPPERW